MKKIYFILMLSMFFSCQKDELKTVSVDFSEKLNANTREIVAIRGANFFSSELIRVFIGDIKCEIPDMTDDRVFFKVPYSIGGQTLSGELVLKTDEGLVFDLGIFTIKRDRSFFDFKFNNVLFNPKDNEILMYSGGDVIEFTCKNCSEDETFFMNRNGNNLELEGNYFKTIYPNISNSTIGVALELIDKKVEGPNIHYKYGIPATSFYEAKILGASFKNNNFVIYSTYPHKLYASETIYVTGYNFTDRVEGFSVYIDGKKMNTNIGGMRDRNVSYLPNMGGVYFTLNQTVSAGKHKITIENDNLKQDFEIEILDQPNEKLYTHKFVYGEFNKPLGDYIYEVNHITGNIFNPQPAFGLQSEDDYEASGYSYYNAEQNTIVSKQKDRIMKLNVDTKDILFNKPISENIKLVPDPVNNQLLGFDGSSESEKVSIYNINLDGGTVDKFRDIDNTNGAAGTALSDHYGINPFTKQFFYLTNSELKYFNYNSSTAIVVSKPINYSDQSTRIRPESELLIQKENNVINWFRSSSIMRSDRGRNVGGLNINNENLSPSNYEEIGPREDYFKNLEHATIIGAVDYQKERYITSVGIYNYGNESAYYFDQEDVLSKKLIPWFTEGNLDNYIFNITKRGGIFGEIPN